MVELSAISLSDSLAAFHMESQRQPRIPHSRATTPLAAAERGAPTTVPTTDVAADGRLQCSYSVELRQTWRKWKCLQRRRTRYTGTCLGRRALCAGNAALKLDALISPRGPMADIDGRARCTKPQAQAQPHHFITTAATSSHPRSHPPPPLLPRPPPARPPLLSTGPPGRPALPSSLLSGTS